MKRSSIQGIQIVSRKDRQGETQTRQEYGNREITSPIHSQCEETPAIHGTFKIAGELSSARLVVVALFLRY